jgi:5-methylthioadenosine/S-adenosylhomocysteine deaminase
VRPLRLRARWALPVDAPPIKDAALLIDADGRITALGPHTGIATPENAETHDLGSATLLPGLVNTHTHLELTGFEEHAPEVEFRDWIQAIRRIKAARAPEDFLAAARRGVRDCWAGGVTTVADTGDSGSVIQALAELGGSGLVYQEVFGPHPEQVDESFGALQRRVGELVRFAGGRVRLGVSPHAPYTVSGPLYSKVATWARAEGLPLAVHLAESREEAEFVTWQRGPFADAWRQRGIPLLGDQSHQPSAVSPRSPVPCTQSPVTWLASHGVLGPRTLCIHAIQLSATDIALLASCGASVAHCPLSNVRHRHGSAPLGALRKAGIRVGLGTDSVASVGRLDLFAEARAARALGGLTAEEAIALCTLDGARALGLDGEIGSLAVGKWGDVIAVDTADGTEELPASPSEAVLAAAPASVRMTLIAGRVVHRSGSPLDLSRGWSV